MEEIAVKETIQIGDKIYNVEDVTPTVYFNYVKDMKKNIEDENLQTVADNCLTLLQKTKITGQTSAAEKIFKQYSLIMRELKAASFGFDTIVYKSDIEKFITNISKHPVKIIELSKYAREVDDSIIDKLVLAKDNNLFDEYYVIFTDYSMKETKKIAAERRDKDPILFGTFQNQSNRTVIDRFYYLGDWEDEYCDLTLDKMVNETEKAGKRNIVRTISTPQDIEELKAQLGSLTEKNNIFIQTASVPEKKSWFSNIKTVFKGKKK